MKNTFLLLAALVFAGCDTPVGDTLRIVDLTITKTTTPKISNVENGITSQVTCSGNNLCYNFLHFTVSKQTANVFDIRAKGTYPDGDPICAMAIYSKDTTLKLSTPTAGEYVVRFYNGDNLFKSDTMQVN